MDSKQTQEKQDAAGLADATGSATGEWRRGRCLCDLCVRISPMQKRIRDALPEELQKDFDYLTMRMMCAEEDRDVSDAKLAGQWPGWEWITAAIVAAEGRVAKSPNNKVSHSAGRTPESEGMK